MLVSCLGPGGTRGWHPARTSVCTYPTDLLQNLPLFIYHGNSYHPDNSAWVGTCGSGTSQGSKHGVGERLHRGGGRMVVTVDGVRGRQGQVGPPGIRGRINLFLGNYRTPV